MDYYGSHITKLIEALTGASYQEIVDDYMLTYDNYYKINRTKDKAKYDVILDKNLNAMLRYLVADKTADADALGKADLQKYSKDFLLSGGMTQEEIDTLVEKISSKK